MKAKMLKILFVLPVLLTIATMTDCGGGSSPPPTSGFKAQGQLWVRGFDGSYSFLTYGPILGVWQFDYANAQGNTKNFSFFAQGYGQVNDGRAPAR